MAPSLGRETTSSHWELERSEVVGGRTATAQNDGRAGKQGDSDSSYNVVSYV